MKAVMKMVVGAVLLAAAVAGGNLHGDDNPPPRQSAQLLAADGIEPIAKAEPESPDSTHDVFLGNKYTFSGPAWFRNTATLGMLVGFVCSLLWISHDAGKRGKDRTGAALFAIFAGWPMSLVWWLWLRPPMRPPPVPHDELAM